MTTVTLALSVPVAAPPETVWAASVDWARQGEWMLGTSVSVVRGDGGSVDSELAAFTGLAGVGFLDTMRITGWLPPYRCDVLHTGALIRGTGTFEVRARPGGGAVFHWREDLVLPWSWLGRLGWLFTGPLFKAGVRRSLRDFARFCVTYREH
ncbi:SRPBCC family protein [Pseudonocardiaceae bacterium YIM PH 21723]|nr:SRPBCC family protein [Pseudonocardiaceae bacterium YIM PH 21723]